MRTTWAHDSPGNWPSTVRDACPLMMSRSSYRTLGRSRRTETLSTRPRQALRGRRLAAVGWWGSDLRPQEPNPMPAGYGPCFPDGERRPAVVVLDPEDPNH